MIFSTLILSGCQKNIDKKQANPEVRLDKELKQKPSLMTFIFQPSLEENTEIVVDFRNKSLTFHPVYPYLPEPPPPPPAKFTKNLEKPLIPYFAKLDELQLFALENLLQDFKTNDFNRIDGTYTDGTSYNFSTLFTDNQLKVGYIAKDKTVNQEKLVETMIKLVDSTNKFDENKRIISYYYTTK